jgi:hypothetical protein
MDEVGKALSSPGGQINGSMLNGDSAAWYAHTKDKSPRIPEARPIRNGHRNPLIPRSSTSYELYVGTKGNTA